MFRAPTINELDAASQCIYRVLQPTPQITWPLINDRCQCEVWVKHENHLPTGSFKVRGGLWYAQSQLANGTSPGIIAATRGNHGQSITFAAKRIGLRSVIVVPEGNNSDKNEAMRALGAELIVHGNGFDEAKAYAEQLSRSEGLDMVPSFNSHLVAGVGTYALELFRSVENLQRIYVPIGLGSGIAGVIAAREALDLSIDIIGVVAQNANAYQQSFQQQKVITTDSADTIADGLAVRIPDADALDIIIRGAERLVAVSEAEIRAAMRIYLFDSHNLAEGAGASALAALLQDQASEKFRLDEGKRAAVVLTGSNIQRDLLAQLLNPC